MNEHDKPEGASTGVSPDRPLLEVMAADTAEASNEGILAVLSALDRSGAAESGQTSPPIEIEFGIGAIEELIADASDKEGIDPLGTIGDGLVESANATGGGAEPDTTPAAMQLHLPIKIVFGDDDANTSGNI